MAKNWKLKREIPADIRQKLSDYSSLEAQLLFNRGITTAEEADVFLHPDYAKLNSPFLFKDMEKAVARIWRAIDNNEKIFIYGDYDADAVTANAVLQQTFKHLNIQAESYIPDRFTEGYGLNLEAFQKIKDQGATVVITVDCGTNSVDAAEFCKQNGIDLIITDHHEIIGPVPDAFALINPKNPNDTYPYSEITGVGVAFKLATAILQNPQPITHNSKLIPGYEKWLLDLVAIGTVADCHTLIGENRILVKFGLKVLGKSKWVGLRTLAGVAGLDFSAKAPDTYTLGFVIAPRLNAAGRLEHADIALSLLLETDPMKALEKARGLEEINNRRRRQTELAMSEAKARAEFIKDRKVLVLQGEDWPKGIVGLVAGKLAEEFHKPTFILAKGELESTGSARTVGEFNVVEALKYSAEFLVKFGGHKQAAGLTLKIEHFESFYGKVLEFAELNLSEEDLVPQLNLEAELPASDLTANTYKLIANMEPFGIGNPHPKFLIKGLTTNTIKMVGATSQHAQFQFKTGNKTISGIAFNKPNVENSFKIGDTVDVAAELIEDNWNGRQDVKLRLVDIKLKD